MTDWMKDAACRGADPALFFPPNGSGQPQPDFSEALAICRSCEQIQACRKWAIETGDIVKGKARHGVIAGLTPVYRVRTGRPVGRPKGSKQAQGLDGKFVREERAS